MTGIMTRILFLSLTLCGALLVSGPHSSAQSTPGGSYKQTCRQISVVGGNLVAQCQRADGSWRNSALNYYDCSGDIWNDNGDLACKGSGSGNVPRGSYKNSCNNYYTEGNRLYASCQKRNGGWRDTSINYRNCDKDIWNDNGELACGGGGGGSGSLPKGSYKDTCKNMYVQGNVLEAECLNRNGKYSYTSIKYKNCNRGVYNDWGQLRCK